MTNKDRTILPVPDQPEETTWTLDVRDTDYPPIKQTQAPAKAPNIVIVLLDDMGFGASSAYGGPCQMPTAQRLGEQGLRFTRFHTTALCSPTRQSLMTGRNHHAVNMGTIANMATSVPGYTSVRPNTAATLAEILRLNGYNTGAFGKWHQTPQWEISSSGPFDRWPTGEGFEKFYGFMDGESDQWSPTLHEGTTPIDTPDDDDYHVSVDITNQAIKWVRQQRIMSPQKPFFCYLSFGATHAPHHVPQEWIEKYRGHFDAGWDRERRAMFKQQKELGVIPEDCELTERHQEIPAWADLSKDDQRVAARLMEAYAGFAEHTDHEVGRLVGALEEDKELDNTLFLYILGDNGASAEGGLYGAVNEIASLNGVNDSTKDLLEVLDEIGGPTTYNHYPAGWAHAMDTPYQWTKQVASHWGGTRVGMIMHWPDGVRHKNENRHHWLHVIDIYPTLLEAAGLPVPRQVHGVAQQRLDGTSFVGVLNDPSCAEVHTTQYFEMFGNRGIYHQGWSACTKHSTPWKRATLKFDDDTWELYGPGDWSQSRNLADEQPEKLAELQSLFLEEAERNHVLPLDDRKAERFSSDEAGRPTLLGERKSIVLYPGMVRLPHNAIPNLRNKSHGVEAQVNLLTSRADGVLISQGSRFGGWVFHIRHGRLAYTHNWLGKALYEVIAKEALPEGSHRLSFHFEYEGNDKQKHGHRFGHGGEATLAVDGKVVAQGRIEQTVPFLYGGGTTNTDIGCDMGSTVVQDYATAQWGFTETIDWVRVTAAPGGSPDPAGVQRDIDIATQ